MNLPEGATLWIEKIKVITEGYVPYSDTMMKDGSDYKEEF
jgi:hypothetical protein